jgi:protein-tyrosine phosphatase
MTGDVKDHERAIRGHQLRYAAIFIMLGGCILFFAIFFVRHYIAWLLFWPATTFLAIGSGYAGIGPRVFGKRPNGSLPGWAIVLYLPFLAMTLATWQVQKKRGNRFEEIVPGIWLGRRAHADELPSSIRTVIDLTSELPEPKDLVTKRSYFQAPTLDEMVPDEGTLLGLVDKALESKGGVYIHCVSGHGRSATLMAAVIMRKGLVKEVGSAIAFLEERRQGIRISSAQRTMLEHLQGRLVEGD